MTKSCGIWSTLLYFSFKKLNDLSSSSFISFSCILHNPEVLFSDFSNFHKFKWGDLISWREPILKNDWIIWSPLLYFSFKSFRDPNSLSFIRFQCILHDSRVLFLDFLNIPKLKRGDLISWQETILHNVWIIWFPFCISILKVLKTQSLCHSLDFKAFRMINKCFSQTFQISTN